MVQFEERVLALCTAHGAIALDVARGVRGDAEHAAAAGLAHELRVLEHADVRRGAADRPPYNGFPLLKFLTQLRERPLDAAVQGGAAGRKLEQGGYDELEEPEEQQW